MFWKNKRIERKINKFISSDKYNASIYELQKVNGMFALKNCVSGKYVDLVSPSHEWRIGSYFFKDCVGSLNNTIAAFNQLNQTIEKFDMVIEKTYNHNV